MYLFVTQQISNLIPQVSHAVVELVHKINDHLSSSSVSGSGHGGDAGYRVAYTFDAGPNACLFLEVWPLDYLFMFIFVGKNKS